MDFRFPDIAEGIVEGKLVGWKVKEGDIIHADQALCEMETDKSVVEIPSPVAGKITKLYFKSGDKVKVGEVLVSIDESGVSASSSSSPSPSSTVPKAEEVKKEIPIPRQEPIVQRPSVQTAQAQVGIINNNIFILPKDRNLAKQKGVDLWHIRGTGKDGRITEDDINAASSGVVVKHDVYAEHKEASSSDMDFSWREKMNYSARMPPSQRQVLHPSSPVSASPIFSPPKANVIVPVFGTEARSQPAHEAMKPSILDKVSHESHNLEGVRAVIAKRLSQSWQKVPHASLAVEVPVGKLVSERERVKSDFEKKGIRLTYMAYIIKVIAAALERYPTFNAVLDEEKNEIVVKQEVNVGFATDTPYGLMVPVIKNANAKLVSTIAKEVHELAEKAHERKLSPQEMSGSTFTISNFGSFGGIGGSSIINHPEVAILTVCSIVERARLYHQEMVMQKVMPLILAFDHRVNDGADAGRFMQFVSEYLSDPSDFLMDVM